MSLREARIEGDPNRSVEADDMGLSRVLHGIRTRGWGSGRRQAGPTAFVLSGGGVLGAVQVGQMHALVEAGVIPDLLVGTSVGAINAVALAADPTPAGVARQRAAWAALTSEDLFPGSRLRRAWQIVSRGDHLYPNDGIRRLADLLPVRTFEQLAIPCTMVATNLRTGRDHYFSSGPIAPAMLASTALPGIFPPMTIDGETYVDGGMSNNVPISRAFELGARRIYVLTCGAQKPMPRPIRGPLDVFTQAVSHSRMAAAEDQVRRFTEVARIEMMPTFHPGMIRFNDPTHSAELMERAYELTRAHLSGTSIVTPSAATATAPAVAPATA